jgi:hypothetical protein
MRRRETPAELGNNDEIRPAASGALIKPLQPTHRDLRFVKHRAFLLRTLYFATPQAANARFLMNFVTNRSENDNAFFVSAASAPCPILSPFFWLQGGRARPHLHRAPSCRLSSGDRVGEHTRICTVPHPVAFLLATGWESTPASAPCPSCRLFSGDRMGEHTLHAFSFSFRAESFHAIASKRSRT